MTFFLSHGKNTQGPGENTDYDIFF
jgi:hypothetical protein